ncbi:MAG: DNA helicase RecQ [Planctomycetales bacterium]
MLFCSWTIGDGTETVEALRDILRTYWGYDDFRPLQADAMRAVVDGRDSVVVLPTGGGKSLCFQAPALHLPGLAVVISPLISLMKDQVDALADCGVPAACVNSTLAHGERRRVADEIRGGRLKLLYLSPERLMTEKTLAFLKAVPLSFFAIDEAHCISEWGHDFRPEYRMLRTLKQMFPRVAVHAYTATAPPHVQRDIARELELSDPAMLVGSFDRPNLIYRAQRRDNLLRQIREVVDRHPNDSGLVYCIRRADVEQVCAALAAGGYDALPYHAGMGDGDRKRNQEAFINDRAKIIVATVAFGMGIDKSNVRYVVHAAAPKSLEAFQQETGRAGRDGLDAECWLFYSDNDFNTWRRLQSELPPQAFQVAMTVLKGMSDFCSGLSCRHRAISKYFGQDLAAENCGACDVCLEEVDLVEDSLVLSQKILSCVVRLKQKFGGDYTAQVLAGSREQRILDNGHDQLSTWGLLAEQDKQSVRGWIEQLVGQGFLAREGEFNTLALTPEGRRALRGEVVPRLAKPAKTRKESRVATASWEGVDRGLFEALRAWRRSKSEERGIPPFIVFGDATLRELARYRPSSLDRLRAVHGIGEKKSAEYGADVVAEIAAYCRDNALPLDVDAPPGEGVERRQRQSAAGDQSGGSPSRELAFELFAQGKSIDEVRQATGRAASTVADYLGAYIAQEGVCDPSFWVEEEVFERIRRASAETGLEKLKPIFEALDGTVDYERIRIAVACLRNAAPASS